MLINYVHVLICICPGEGSRHFSAILLQNSVWNINYSWAAIPYFRIGSGQIDRNIKGKWPKFQTLIANCLKYTDNYISMYTYSMYGLISLANTKSTLKSFISRLGLTHQQCLDSFLLKVDVLNASWISMSVPSLGRLYCGVVDLLFSSWKDSFTPCGLSVSTIFLLSFYYYWHVRHGNLLITIHQEIVTLLTESFPCEFTLAVHFKSKMYRIPETPVLTTPLLQLVSFDGIHGNRTHIT